MASNCWISAFKLAILLSLSLSLWVIIIILVCWYFSFFIFSFTFRGTITHISLFLIGVILPSFFTSMTIARIFRPVVFSFYNYYISYQSVFAPFPDYMFFITLFFLISTTRT